MVDQQYPTRHAAIVWFRPILTSGGAAQLWFAAGGLVFCWIHAQRQPWLRFNYTAGAGYGNMNA
jgi:hypothetical protein